MSGGTAGGVRLRGAALGPSRWRGEPGRLEVWYATFTDPATGEGYWLHHELVAPLAAEAYVHGWGAVFPPGAAAEYWRFGPEPVPASVRSDVWFTSAGTHVDAGHMRGSAGAMSWDVAYSDEARPLYTFPRWAWEREALPAAQVVPAPSARFDGTVRAGDREVRLDGAIGGVARIYGHGNAKRWAWLHADLGGGDVLEVIAAVSKRPGMNRLPPLPIMRLRLDGIDRPREPLTAAMAGSAEIALPRWRATSLWGRRRVRVDVTVPPECSVAVPYTDPDGESCVCTNSERASATVVLERWAGRWTVEREWRLDGTAHAEVGLR
jgi:hypothetical protein